MRRRYVYDKATRGMVEVQPRAAEALHFIQPDYAGYESPVSGLWIEGRKARREDLRRNNCRPYEGREQEGKVAAAARADQERKLDGLADRMARTAWGQAPERVRKVFRGR